MAAHLWETKKVDPQTRRKLYAVRDRLVVEHKFPVKEAECAAVWAVERLRQAGSGAIMGEHPYIGAAFYARLIRMLVRTVRHSRGTWRTDPRLPGAFRRLVK